MKLEIVTSLWGDWHLSMYLRLALPTLVAPDNLPALARLCDLRYRIMTTPNGRRALLNSSLFHLLRRHVEIDINLIGNSETPDLMVHIDMMHAGLRRAAEQHAYVAIVPPDVLWANGNFPNLLSILRERRPKGLAIPCVRIASESAAPELQRLHERQGTPELALTPREIQTFVLRHLHTEQLAMLHGGPGSRPTLWASFPVKGGGLIHCTFNREWFAVAPGELRVTNIFCNDQSLTDDDYYVCQDANLMLMASLTPLRSYIGEFRRNSPFQEIDVSATLNMDQHGVPFSWTYIRTPLTLGNVEDRPASWTRTRRRARLWAHHALVLSTVLRFFTHVRKTADTTSNHDFQLLGDLIAYAAFEPKLFSDRRLRRPVACFVPLEFFRVRDGHRELTELGDLGEFFSKRIWDHVCTIDPDLVSRFLTPPDKMLGDFDLTTFSGVRRRLRLNHGEWYFEGRQVQRSFALGGNLVGVY